MNDFDYIILKKLISNNEFFGKTMPILKAKYFNTIGNQELFKIIKEHYNTYKQIPTNTELVAQIRNIPNSETRNLVVEDIQKVSKTEEVQNLDFMLNETVKFVKDAMYQEAIILGADGLQKKNDEYKVKARAIMEEMAKVSIDSDLGLDYDDIEEMIRYYQEKLIGVRTSHKELNKRLGSGFLPKTLSVIMAASGIGKSLMMTDLLSGMIKEGKNVLLVSMEMQDKEIMKRVHANALDLPINDLRNLPVEAIRQAYTREKENVTGKFFVKDYPNGTFSALMLEQLLDSYEVEKGVKFDIVFLDYLGIMKSDLVSPSAGLYSYVKSIVEETRAVAVKREIPIVSASQLNRSAVNSVDASNDAVSDSIGTVHTADFIMFLLQNETMKEEKIITAKVTKNRFTGRTDSWDMNIDYDHMRFSDLLVQSGKGLTEDEAQEIIRETQKQDLEIMQQHGMSEDDGFDIMAELGLPDINS